MVLFADYLLFIILFYHFINIPLYMYIYNRSWWLSWLSARRANLCVCKEGPTEFETRWLQEIPFSKELTDNYW